MSLSDFRGYLIKYKRFLAFLVAAAIVLCMITIKTTQTYCAEVYIHYLGDKAANGYAPDGSKLNLYEIINSQVIKNALETCDIDGVNVEEVRKNITITPVLPTYEEEKYASWIENFTSYDETEENRANVVYYRIRYETDKGEATATEVLNAVITSYKEYYVQNHVYNNDITEISLSDLKTYDYYEAVALIGDKIKSDTNILGNLLESDPNYRSPKTGYSLTDISDMYKNVYDEYVSSIAEDILQNGISKNKDTLITRYNHKIDSSVLESAENADKAASQSDLMILYADKNKEYLWDENNRRNNEGESEQVREDVERDRGYDESKSVYDTIALDFVTHLTKSKDLLIDKEDYEAVISYFKIENDNGYAVNPQTEEQISTLYKKYEDIAKVSETTISDYNLFSSSRYLSCISGIATHESISEVVYYSLAVIIALCLGVLFIVLSELRKKRIL